VEPVAYGQLLTATAVAELLGVPVSTIEAWRLRRIGPPAVRVGRAVRWRHHSVAAWAADGGALEFGIVLSPVPVEGNGAGDDLRVSGVVYGPSEGISA